MQINEDNDLRFRFIKLKLAVGQYGFYSFKKAYSRSLVIRVILLLLFKRRKVFQYKVLHQAAIFLYLAP